MLVLTRRVGETLVIDGNIRVTVLSVDGERVSIGVDAPRSAPIVRQELFDAVQAENRLAANRVAPDRLLTRLGGAPAAT